MTVLSELVEHHADEEQDEMFEIAQKIGEARPGLIDRTASLPAC